MESIIKDVGGCGRYQTGLVLVIMAFQTVVVASLLSMVFGGASRPWRCIEAGTVSHRDYSPTLNETFHEGRTAASANGSSTFRYDSVCTTSTGSRCLDVEFEAEWKTVVQEWKLVCDRQWVPATIIMSQMLGVLLGNIAGGHLADTVGRKRPYFLGMFVVILGNLLAFLSVTWQMLAASLGVVGFGVGCVLIIDVNIACEFVLSKWRSVITNVPAWPIQGAISALLSWLIQDWRYIHLTIAMMGVPFLAAWWFVPESFRWCLARKRLAEAEEVIHRVAAINGRTELAGYDRHSLETMVSQIPPERRYSVLDLFRQKSLVKTTLLLSTMWFTIGLAEYAIRFGVKDLSGDLFLNSFLFNLVIMPSMSIATFLNNRIGRRMTSIICFSVATTFSLVTGLLQYFGISGGVVNGFALASYLGLGTAWGPVLLLTVESYPTVVRNIGNGFQNVIARCGGALSPQLILLDGVVPGLLYGTCAAIALLSLGATCFIRETKGRNLADNINSSRPRRDIDTSN